ncbi:lipopolysaccharide biosynthesis protein [Frigoriflavimonas asaccharolytica]|uniref:O-antigen/teichoic acid export membrane protein n=1 Tax=Frigoriflavimonas asaccharolytica TaxID=2735899 RepID=A0A8J8G5B2_9FLAO|nr:oligosaccharide flippase family protein [Frigoriflavimonas asaccharolytica]NRS91723.1 O-antigen/teichoic acid export membrane protein [Frigoriflavimonas asaccharolytica]
MSLFNIFERAKTNVFFKNVATLASGTIISQLVVIASSPLLTRLYTVESFGLLSLFTSYVVIFAVISTGRYELAVPLPTKDVDGRKIIQLIFGIGFISAIAYFILIFISKEILQLQTHFELLNHWWIYLAPLYIFFIALYSGLGYWYQRKKNYKKITLVNAFQVIITAVCSIVFGFLKIESGLILSLILGILFSIFYFLKEYVKENQIFSLQQVKEIGREFISFPKYMTVSDLSLTASQQIIPISFEHFFSTTVLGFYSMASRMIRIPNIVITNAIGNVFRNDAIDEIRSKGNCKDLYKSTFKKLILMSFPIYLLVFLLSPMLFSFFFGEEWFTAGVYARILSILLFFEFVASPLNSVFYIREKKKQFARLQFLNAIFGALGLYCGFYFWNSAIVSLMFFTGFSIIFNLIFLYFSFKYSEHV